MALTSEQVTEDGEKVIEHVNRLAEQMFSYQQRIDGLSDLFDSFTENMNQHEDSIRTSFNTMASSISGDWMEQTNEIGSQLESAVKTPCVEGIERFQGELDTEFLKVSDSSEATVKRWNDWRETDLTELRTSLVDHNDSQSDVLTNLNDTSNEDAETISDTSSAFMDESGGRLEELRGYLTEATAGIESAGQDYNQIMLESFGSQLEELMTITSDTLKTSQTDISETMLTENIDQFRDIVGSKMVPLIDEMVEEVSESINKMIEDIINIGDDAGDKSQAMDMVSELLEKIIQPIKDMIDRTQGIKDVVDVFI